MAKPMVLTKENVIATMEGCKTMTRRIIKNIHLNYIKHTDIKHWAKYSVGDEVYVAEGYRIPNMDMDREQALIVLYLSDRSYKSVKITKAEMKLFKARKFPFRATPGRFMYKSLARTFMTITEVRVERLQEISAKDCMEEGVQKGWYNDQGESPGRYLYFTGVDAPGHGNATAKKAFEILWNSIHGPGAWERNDWVWVYKWRK